MEAGSDSRARKAMEAAVGVEVNLAAAGEAAVGTAAVAEATTVDNDS